MKLDRLRAFGQICPPEQFACHEGESIAVAMREPAADGGNPEAYAVFIRAAAGKATFKTACYEQDGLLFDALGDLIKETVTPEAAERLRMIQARRNADAAARRAYEKAMLDAGLPLVPVVVPSAAIDATNIGGLAGDGAEGDEIAPGQQLDIPAYFQGLVSAPWFAVSKAIREQHGISASGKEEAKMKLIEAKILPMSMATV